MVTGMMNLIRGTLGQQCKYYSLNKNKSVSMEALSLRIAVDDHFPIPILKAVRENSIFPLICTSSSAKRLISS